MNVVHLIGRLGRDPEGRTTQSGASVANLTVATSERWKDRNGEKKERTEWHRVVAWNHSADFATRYLRKGRLVRVTGQLETRKWQDKDGIDRYTTEIKASVIKGLDKATDGEGQQSQAHNGGYQSGSSMSDAAGYGGTNPTDDDEIPF